MQARCICLTLAQTNDFYYHEIVHAVYTDFEHTFGKFGIQGGLRLEDARINTHLLIRPKQRLIMIITGACTQACF